MLSDGSRVEGRVSKYQQEDAHTLSVDIYLQLNGLLFLERVYETGQIERGDAIKRQIVLDETVSNARVHLFVWYIVCAELGCSRSMRTVDGRVYTLGMVLGKREGLLKSLV